MIDSLNISASKASCILSFCILYNTKRQKRGALIAPCFRNTLHYNNLRLGEEDLAFRPSPIQVVRLQAVSGL
jgi:hypothetical protein